MLNPIKTLTIFIAAGLLLPLAAQAAPRVELSTTAEKETAVIEDGQLVVKRVPATEAAPGDTVIFTISFRNSGDEPATDVVISNPLPPGTAYVPGSATETGELAFSIDGGDSYKKPSLLTYEVRTADGRLERRVATPETYTNVRWVIDRIAPGAGGAVEFRVIVN